jgi:hypothetical protein
MLRLLGESAPAEALEMFSELLAALCMLEEVEFPFELEQRYPVQGFVWNIFRCVRARLHHTFVLYLDFVAPAADGELRRELAAHKERSVAVALGESNAVVAVVCGGPVGQAAVPRSLSWGDMLKKMWAVSQVARLGTCPEAQRQSSAILVSEMGRLIGLRGGGFGFVEEGDEHHG